MTIGDVGERGLIERVRRRAGAAPPWLTVGIGDDAAVIEPQRGALDVVTTDGLVEHVHFEWVHSDPASVGYKAVAINLSDLAAMGAAPRAVLLTLTLPAGLPLADFDALIDGAVEAAAEARANLVGGNLARSPGPAIVDVTAIGSVRPRKMLTRSGGRPGDDLYLTGTVGAAAAGLGLSLGNAAERASLAEPGRECLARFARPLARVRCGVTVARSRSAHAAVDLSDGLANAAWLLAEASGTGALLEASLLPIHAGAVAWARRQGDDPVAFAVNGGEDYELLFAVPPRRRRAFLAAAAKAGGLAVTRVGRLTNGTGASLLRESGEEPLGLGYQHF